MKEIVLMLIDFVFIGAIWLFVAREEVQRDQTATTQMWNRSLEFYRPAIRKH